MEKKLRCLTASMSKEMDMIGRLHADIFTQHPCMLTGVDVKVKLTPTKDVFSLIAPDSTIAYESLITFATLIARKVKVNHSISLAHIFAVKRQIPSKNSSHKATVYTQRDVITHPGQFDSHSLTCIHRPS